jgi:hypothetical protein
MTNDDPRRRWREPVPDEPATSTFAAINEPSADMHADHLGQAAEHFGHTPRGQTPAEHHTPNRNAHDPTERTRRENPAGSTEAAAGSGVTQRIPQAAAPPAGPYPTPQVAGIAGLGQTPSEAAVNRRMPANAEVPPPYPPARAVPTEDTGPIETTGGRPVAWSNPSALPALSRPMPAEYRIHPGARNPISGRPPRISESQIPAASAFGPVVPENLPRRAVVLRPWHALWVAAGVFLLVAILSPSSLGWTLLAVAAGLGGVYASMRYAERPSVVQAPTAVSGPPDMPRTPLVPLRAMTIPELFTGTARIMGRNWPSLLGIPVAILVGFCFFLYLTAAVIGHFILTTAMSFTGDTLLNPDSLGAEMLIIGVVYTVVVAVIAFPADALLIALSVIATDRAVRGRPLRSAEVLRQARSRMFAVCRLTLVFYLITLSPEFLFWLIVANSPSAMVAFAGPGGIVLTIIVFFVVFFGLGLLLSLAPIAVVVEGRGVGAALKRSVGLLKPAFWRILGIHLLWSICMSVVVAVFFLMLGKQMVADLLGNPLLALGDLLLFAAVLGVMLGFFRVLQALIYTDVRIRQEGYDRELIQSWNRASANGLATDRSDAAGKPLLVAAVVVAVVAAGCIGWSAFLSGPSDRQIMQALKSHDSSSLFKDGRPRFHIVKVAEAQPGWYVVRIKLDDVEVEQGTVILRDDQISDGSLQVFMGPGTAFPCASLPESVQKIVLCFDEP